MTQLEREQAAMQEESSPVIERYLSFLALHAMGYNWGTTRGDSLPNPVLLSSIRLQFGYRKQEHHSK
jgi:hypothetical protein